MMTSHSDLRTLPDRSKYQSAVRYSGGMSVLISSDTARHAGRVRSLFGSSRLHPLRAGSSFHRYVDTQFESLPKRA